MKIKAILEVYVSKLNSNGNRKRFATLTNIQNGESITFETDGRSNSNGQLEKAGLKYDEIKIIETENIPLKDFNQAMKNIDTDYRNSQEFTKLFKKFLKI